MLIEFNEIPLIFLQPKFLQHMEFNFASKTKEEGEKMSKIIPHVGTKLYDSRPRGKHTLDESFKFNEAVEK